MNDALHELADPRQCSAVIGPETLFALLGSAVLVPIPHGEKGPKLMGWQKLRQKDMTPAYVMRLSHGSNIGVVLGAASEGLCTIDVDSDEHLEEFLELNPHLRESLISRGARGGNVWSASGASIRAPLN